MKKTFEAHPAQVELAKRFSSVTLLGPPMGEKLVRLVAHLFSPEEAELARHLPAYYPRLLAKIAVKAGRRPEEIEPLLEALARRRVIYGGARGYSLLPLIPGMFEYMLMDGRDSDWHRQYARLLTDLFSTGYVRNYNTRSLPAVRNIPVQSVIENQSRVLDADRMEEMIDRHELMAVLNVCQCRQSLYFLGHECKRSSPQDGCLVFGSFARDTEAGGNGRRVSKPEMRAIVTERWEKKLVFLTGNVAPASPNAICTCCDCCCHFLETVNHYQGKALVAASHFLARVDETLCNHCGKCAQVCNTYAHTFADKQHAFDISKCIGCGVCLGSCKPQAIAMVENPAYQPPAQGFGRLGLRLFPAGALSALQARRAK